METQEKQEKVEFDKKFNMMNLKLHLLVFGFDIVYQDSHELIAERKQTDEHKNIRVCAYRGQVLHSVDKTRTGVELLEHFDLVKLLDMPFAKRAWISTILIIISVANLYLI